MSASSIAVIAGPQLADYHFGVDHPFGPYRHQAFLEGMDKFGLTSHVDWLEPVQCCYEELRYFHTAEYIELVRQMSKLGTGYLDPDTPARKGIYESGSTVVGSVLDMIGRIISKQYRRGFIPIAGLHHGYRDRSSGFCVFNDCAIAIEYLREQHQLRKILYVDIDAHHGDGVFYNYETDKNLYVVDFHEDGRFLYPGTGNADETGSGQAKGTKLNFPMKKDSNDKDFAALWPVAEKFIRSIDPEFIILQCGADSMKGDPITDLEYSQRSHQLVTESLCEIADEFCDGRLVALGGGGYNTENISLAWPTAVKAMLK